jgi:hypothetical protein
MKPILTFIYMDGCGACEAAKPELAAFKAAHPEIAIRRIDLLKTPWPPGAWAPTATPTYLAEFGNRRPVGKVGAMRKAEIEQFMRIAAPKLGLPVPF